jgi:hypothetical protein
MSIATDIVNIKNFIATKFSGQDQIIIIRHQIRALELYRDRKLIPGIQIMIKATSDGATLSQNADQRVIAIRTEIANLYGLLETESLPSTGLDF